MRARKWIWPLIIRDATVILAALVAISLAVVAVIATTGGG